MSGRPIIGMTMDREGEYLRVKDNYAPALVNAGGVPIALPSCNDPEVVAGVIDGLVIPGGADVDPSYYGESPLPATKPVGRERTDFEIALLRTIMKLGKPVLGICYGMQLLNVACGGDLYQDLETQFVSPINHTRGEHALVADGEFMNGHFVVNSSHHQAVRSLGRDLVDCAVSEDKLVEAFVHTDYPFLLGVQWHPERSRDTLSLDLLRIFVEKARGNR